MRKPGEKNQHGAATTIVYRPQRALRAGDRVRLNDVSALSEVRCVLYDPANFSYTLDASAKRITFPDSPCPDAPAVVEVHDAASGRILLPKLTPQSAGNGNLTVDLCAYDFTKTRFVVYMGFSPDGIEYPAEPFGTQPSAGCPAAPPARTALSGAPVAPVAISEVSISSNQPSVESRPFAGSAGSPRDSDPVAAALRSSSPDGRLLAFAQAPPAPAAPAARTPAQRAPSAAPRAAAADQASKTPKSQPAAGNAQPVITGISPQTVSAGSAVSVKVTGSSFPKDAALVPASAGVKVSGKKIVSDSEIDATLTIARDVPPGTVSILVLGVAANIASEPYDVTILPPSIPARGPIVLSSLQPATGAAGATLQVALSGTGFPAGAEIGTGNAGIAVSNVTRVSDTQMSATFTLARDAAPGPTDVRVFFSGSFSSSQPFTVSNPGANPPLFDSGDPITPATVAAGKSVSVVLRGRNFTGATVSAPPGSGITLTDLKVVDDTTINATLATATSAKTSKLTVTTSGGAATITFTVTPIVKPSVTAIKPKSGAPGASVAVTLTGSFSPDAKVSTDDSAITVNDTKVSSDGSTITATFVIDGSAKPDLAKVTVETAGGQDNSQKFAVALPALTSLDHATGTVGATISETLTGTNLTSDTTISLSNPDIAVSKTTQQSPTQITATFAIKPTAATGPVTLTVTNPAGTSEAPSKALFTVNPLPAKPDSVIQVTEGSTIITGHYDTSTPPSSVSAEVISGESLLQRSDGNTIGTNGNFTINLSQPVGSEDTIRLYGVTDSTKGDFYTTKVVPSVFDWGRVQAYFTFGIVLSSNQSTTNNGQSVANPFSTTSASPFIAFDLDKNWLLDAGPRRAFNFNSFFNARLTQIGTSQLSTTTSVNALLANKQAASLQGGGYIPINITRWDYRNRYYSLYVAPLIKGGFYTASDNPITGLNEVSPTSFYKFYGGGVRIGHYREYRYWDGAARQGHAPEQLSFIDFLIGKWGNFESAEKVLAGTDPIPGKDPATGCLYAGAAAATQSAPATPPCLIRARPWRLGFEGILKVPNSPFILGLSANVSASHAKSKLGANYPFLVPPDDLRFLIGVRFDGKTLLTPLTKLGTTP